MKKNQEKDKDTNLVIMLLVVIIFILVIGMAFLFYRYEKLESKYDRRLESGYFYDFDDDFDLPNDDKLPVSDDKKTSKTTKKPTSVVNYISREKALSIALKDMKLSTSDVYDIDVEFENKTTHGNYVYEVSFDYQNYEYEYFIDAKTGKIITSFKSRD